MIKAYKSYRSYGHGRFASAVLAVPDWWLYSSAALIGTLTGLFWPS